LSAPTIRSNNNRLSGMFEEISQFRSHRLSGMFSPAIGDVFQTFKPSRNTRQYWISGFSPSILKKIHVFRPLL
jgi:hypothetical protein